jgi:hypothetical protein
VEGVVSRWKEMQEEMGKETFEEKNIRLNQEAKGKLEDEGLKYDYGKPRIELVPPEFIIDVAEVLTRGADKYTDDNWQLGMSWERVYGSLQRHLLAWIGGEDRDSETGLNHLAHAGSCLSFLIWYQYHYTEGDDRIRVLRQQRDETKKTTKVQNGAKEVSLTDKGFAKFLLWAEKENIDFKESEDK